MLSFKAISGQLPAIKWTSGGNSHPHREISLKLLSRPVPWLSDDPILRKGNDPLTVSISLGRRIRQSETGTVLASMELILKFDILNPHYLIFTLDLPSSFEPDNRSDDML